MLGTSNLHRYVRLAEIVIVGVLGIFAALTYWELRTLRKQPVVLPNYHFDVLAESGKQVGILSRGTWVAMKGPSEPLQTVTIECRRARMECVESAAAIVFIGGKGLLESVHTRYEVDRWTDSEIQTRPAVAGCTTRMLVFDLGTKRAENRVEPNSESSRCAETPAKTLELVAGYRAKAA